MEQEHTTAGVGAEGGKVQPPRPQLVLAVMLRKQGRVRFSARELEEIAGQGRIGAKPIEGGGWVFEWQENAG